MSSLRHLRIDVQVRNRWIDRELDYRDHWRYPERPFDLCMLENLDTLRIPLKLFIGPDEISMHSSTDVLPAALKTLVLFVDLQLHRAERLDNEESEWRGDEGDGQFISDPQSCAQTIRLATEFLQDIHWCADRSFTNLRTLILEYKIDDGFGDRDWSVRDKAMREFIARLQVLEASFQTQGIHFNLTAL